MRYILTFIIFTVIIGCSPTLKEDNATYFGGEIVNPQSNYVLFLQDDIVIDTFKLDNNNRFLAKFDSINEGLYTFKHGLEFQYIYIEPTDSVLVRLNTWDFDESIVFSGKGSGKNEFLINLFLQNEVDETVMYDFFSLNEEVFQIKLDSLALVRQQIYDGFIANEASVSEGFQNLANVALNYPLYRLKEVYPYYYKNKHQLDKFPIISNNFYSYRNNINLNNNTLLSFYPYQNYVINYLYNLSYLQKEKDSAKHDITTYVLNAVIKHISSEEIKNTLLKRIIVNDFLKSESTCTINNEKLSLFLKNCTNEEYVNQVQQLVSDSKFVENNEQLPNFELTTLNNETTNILEVIKNKKAVIYFWSTEFMSADYLVNRIKFLEEKHPNILFIGVQMQSNYIDINNDPKLKMLNLNKQYKLTPTSFANNFLTSRYPRIIIANDNSLVMNGFTYLDSKKLGHELHKLEIN
jgi:hypothetical protein